MTAPNPNSILDSVKQAIGLSPDNQAFDLDVKMFINAAFGALQQLGVGSDTGFWISDNTTLWSQYVTSLSYLGMVQTYIFMKAKLAFDPPQNSFGIDAIKNQIEELAWRINIAVEREDPPSDPFGHSVGFAQGGVLTSFFAPKVVHLDFNSVITPNAADGNVFYLTMTGDCTINAPINGSDAEHITLEITSQGHSVTWGNGWNFGSQGEPTLTAEKTDIVSSVYRASATEWFAGSTPGF